MLARERVWRMISRFRLKTSGFRSDRRGSVLVICAIALPIVIGVASLVAEFGSAIATKASLQRTADLSAYAGALAYAVNKSSQQMQATALNVASLNVVASGNVGVSLVTSPKSASAQAVNVSISVNQTPFLARALGFTSNLTITAAATAQIASNPTPGCILALSPSETGVTLSGGAQISAPTCTVNSNSGLTLPCGVKVTALGATYNSAAAPSVCPYQATLVNSSGQNVTPVKQSTPDPLANSTAVANAAARIATVSAQSIPALPTIPTGTDIRFDWSGTDTTKNAIAAAGCTATWSSPVWTVDCSKKTTVNFGSISLGGGITLNFALNGAATTVYNFSGSITGAGGSPMNFGPGVYNIAQGISTAGGGSVTFGAGTFRIGRGTTACNGGPTASICNTYTLTFGGPSTFVLPGGIDNTGGATLTLGSGSGNSYQIGPASTGDAITIGGSGSVYMFNATTFQLNGNINGGGGSSCLAIPATTNHDINGNVLAAGSIAMGAGVYTVNGYFALGANGGGGGASCNGTTSVTGNNVTLVLSGKQTSNSGSCSGSVFCVSAGYSGVVLTAPTSGATANLAVIGPQDSTRTGGAIFAEGGSGGVISGALYFPYGPLTMSGGANASGLSSSQCFQPIATHITLTGGTAAASQCVASTAAGSSKVSIVR